MRVPILWAAAALLATAGELAAQYTLSAPSGETIEFTADRLLEFRQRSDSLQQDLEDDPRIAYYPDFGPDVPAGEPDAALPWNAMEVVADSLAAIVMPGNLREARRAYVNYAVLRMNAVRADPDVACDRLFDREIRAVRGFVEGWVVARTLFGGPAYAPLDELAFASESGVLPGLVADRSDRQLGGCLHVWREAHGEEMERYRTWRDARYAPADGPR